MRVLVCLVGGDEEAARRWEKKIPAPKSEKLEYAVDFFCPRGKSLNERLDAASEFLSQGLGTNDVVVLANAERVQLRGDPLAAVALLYRSKLHVVLAGSRAPLTGMPSNVQRALPKLPSSKAKARYPDAGALVVGYVGALRAIFQDAAVRRRANDAALGLLAPAARRWDLFWTLAFVKSSSNHKTRGYPLIGVDFWEELHGASTASKRPCFSVRPASTLENPLVWTGAFLGLVLVALAVAAVAFAVAKKRRANAPLPTQPPNLVSA